jgi:hypothetical protein
VRHLSSYQGPRPRRQEASVKARKNESCRARQPLRAIVGRLPEGVNQCYARLTVLTETRYPSAHPRACREPFASWPAQVGPQTAGHQRILPHLRRHRRSPCPMMRLDRGCGAIVIGAEVWGCKPCCANVNHPPGRLTVAPTGRYFVDDPQADSGRTSGAVCGLCNSPRPGYPARPRGIPSVWVATRGGIFCCRPLVQRDFSRGCGGERVSRRPETVRCGLVWTGA